MFTSMNQPTIHLPQIMKTFFYYLKIGDNVGSTLESLISKEVACMHLIQDVIEVMSSQCEKHLSIMVNVILVSLHRSMNVHENFDSKRTSLQCILSLLSKFPVWKGWNEKAQGLINGNTSGLSLSALFMKISAPLLEQMNAQYSPKPSPIFNCVVKMGESSLLFHHLIEYFFFFICLYNFTCIGMKTFYWVQLLI